MMKLMFQQENSLRGGASSDLASWNFHYLPDFIFSNHMWRVREARRVRVALQERKNQQKFARFAEPSQSKEMTGAVLAL